MFPWFPLATSTKESSGFLWDKVSSRYTQLWYSELVCVLAGENRLFHCEEHVSIIQSPEQIGLSDYTKTTSVAMNEVAESKKKKKIYVEQHKYMLLCLWGVNNQELQKGLVLIVGDSIGLT